MYSELVRNLEFLLKYSSKPSSASGLPLTTALNSRSLSKRFGSFWLRDKCKVLGSSGEQGRESATSSSGRKEGDRGELVGGKKTRKYFIFESREKQRQLFPRILLSGCSFHQLELVPDPG